MHGRRGGGGGERCGRRRRLVRHMWPAARVEAEAPRPPAQGPATAPSRSFAPPPSPRTTDCPQVVPARKHECVDSPRSVSPDSFIKDGCEVRVGDCALIRAVDGPPFIGLIRWIEKKEEGHPKLRAS